MVIDRTNSTYLEYVNGYKCFTSLEPERQRLISIIIVINFGNVRLKWFINSHKYCEIILGVGLLLNHIRKIFFTFANVCINFEFTLEVQI